MAFIPKLGFCLLSVFAVFVIVACEMPTSSKCGACLPWTQEAGLVVAVKALPLW